MKIIFFDCDETLWTSSDKDYISSHKSSLTKVNKNTLIREIDGKLFILKNDIFEALDYLKANKVLIGIVSDNERRVVIKALKLFKIYTYFDEKIINIKLWDGYCPKEKMILEVISKSVYKNVSMGDIYWFDDKDYSKEAERSGINFIKVQRRMNIMKEIKEIEIN